MERSRLLEEAVRQHEDLWRAVAQIRALRGKLEDDNLYDELRRDLTGRAARFGEKLAEHFRFEEEGGYFAHVGTSRPGLLPRVAELKRQHERLLAEANAVTVALKRGVDLETAFTQIEVTLEHLKRHEGAEALLLQESVIDDTG